MEDIKIAIIGCGVMGKSILKAIIASKIWNWTNVKASVKDDAEKETLQSDFPDLDIILCNQTLVDWADVIILWYILLSLHHFILFSLKPQILFDSLSQNSFKSSGTDKLFISIAAGIRLEFLNKFLSNSSAVIRVMPNVACSVQESMTVICPSQNCPKEKLDLCIKIFGTAGRCRLLPESQFDVATAICGSGPAFFCTVIEGFVAGAVKMGMPVDIAQELATQTMKGTASMILDGPVHPAIMRDRVTTPGGCTIDGLARMESGSIRSVLLETIEQCTKRARGMGN